MSDTEVFVVLCPWGMFDPAGAWMPNPALSMSVAEQYRQNVANGYIQPPKEFHAAD